MEVETYYKQATTIVHMYIHTLRAVAGSNDLHTAALSRDVADIRRGGPHAVDKLSSALSTGVTVVAALPR